MPEYLTVDQDMFNTWGDSIKCHVCENPVNIGDKLYLGVVMWEKHDEDFEKPWKWPHKYYFDHAFMCEKCKDNPSHPNRGLPEWLHHLDDGDVRRLLIEFEQLATWSMIDEGDYGNCNVHPLTDEEHDKYSITHADFQQKMFEGKYNTLLRMFMINWVMSGWGEVSERDFEWIAEGFKRDEHA